MEVLIVIGGILVALIVAAIVWPLVAAVAIVAFLAWLCSGATGVPFWVAFAIIAIVGLVAALFYRDF